MLEPVTTISRASSVSSASCAETSAGANEAPATPAMSATRTIDANAMAILPFFYAHDYCVIALS